MQTLMRILSLSTILTMLFGFQPIGRSISYAGNLPIGWIPGEDSFVQVLDEKSAGIVQKNDPVILVVEFSSYQIVGVGEGEDPKIEVKRTPVIAEQAEQTLTQSISITSETENGEIRARDFGGLFWVLGEQVEAMVNQTISDFPTDLHEDGFGYLTGYDNIRANLHLISRGLETFLSDIESALKTLKESETAENKDLFRNVRREIYDAYTSLGQSISKLESLAIPPHLQPAISDLDSGDKDKISAALALLSRDKLYYPYRIGIKSKLETFERSEAYKGLATEFQEAR